MSPETKLSRRTLVKTLGVGMAGIGTAGLLPAPYLIDQEVKHIYLAQANKSEQKRNQIIFDRTSNKLSSDTGLESFKPLIENPRYRRLYASAALFFLSIPLGLKGLQIYYEGSEHKSK